MFWDLGVELFEQGVQVGVLVAHLVQGVGFLDEASLEFFGASCHSLHDSLGTPYILLELGQVCLLVLGDSDSDVTTLGLD